MPANVVKNERDEELWERAKEIVLKQYKGVNEGSKRFYRLVMGIYQRMKGEKSMARSLAKSRNGQLYMIRSFKKSGLLVGGHNWPPKAAGPDVGLEELRGALDIAIKEYMGPAKGTTAEPVMDSYPWIEDIYHGYVIVRKGAERYRVLYKMVNGKIEVGPKEKVRAVYVPVEKSRAKNIHQNPPKEYREEGAIEREDYADPENYKYPLHTEKNVRAAMAYFSRPKNYLQYNTEKRKAIWRRIVRAAQKYDIDVSEGVKERSEAKKSLGVRDYLRKARNT